MDTLQRHEESFTNSGMQYQLSHDITAVHEKHLFLRYDYIGRRFSFYHGREHCDKQEKDNRSTLRSLIGLLEDHLYYEVVPGGILGVTGGYELKRTWFPYSRLYRSPGPSATPQEKARSEFLSYLQDSNLIGTRIDAETQANVLAQIHMLIQKYGNTTLGFGRQLPVTLGPALRRFDLILEPVTAHSSTDKIIRFAIAAEDATQ
jgi:hypothetical protein